MNLTLSDKAKQICKEHYKGRCDKCPLYHPCHKEISRGWDGLEMWTNDVNEKANKGANINEF